MKIVKTALSSQLSSILLITFMKPERFSFDWPWMSFSHEFLYSSDFSTDRISVGGIQSVMLLKSKSVISTTKRESKLLGLSQVMHVFSRVSVVDFAGIHNIKVVYSCQLTARQTAFFIMFTCIPD